MPYQLDYPLILPRQSPPPSQQQQPTQTTTLGIPGVTPTGLNSDTTVVAINGSPTVTDLGLSAVATGDSTSLLTAPSSSASTNSSPQTFPPRTLVAICVSAGILLGGVIIFALWWDRSKKNASEETHGEESFSHGASTQDMKLRGLAGVHVSPPPPIDTLRRPSSGNTAYDHDHGYHSAGGKGGYDHDVKQSLDVGFPPPMGSNYTQENSFLSLTSVRVDPLRPQTASPSTPPQSAPQSPRSTSAQPITHPYSVGAHPFVSPSISHAPLHRPSFERTATSTTAIAQDPSARLGPSTAGFAGAGARPGYDAYGFEPRTAGAISPNHNGTIVHRPSIESIRNLARKASQPNIPSEPAYPPTGGYTRTRNNSTSTYAGSVRAGKVKQTKEEKAKEMAAMDNLIAALDESAEAERRRKERLVAAAGILDNQQSSSKKGAGTGRRMDAAITGSYPLPPPNVFRAALGRGVADADDEPDDNEIERWRRN